MPIIWGARSIPRFLRFTFFSGETKTFRPRILSRRLPQPGRTESLWRRRWNKRDYLTAKRTKFLAMTFNFTVLRLVLEIEVKDRGGTQVIFREKM